MKKLVLLLTFFSVALQGQEVEPAIQQSIAQEVAPAPEESAPETEDTPSAIYVSTEAAKSSSDWQNWIFAGSAAVVFTAAVLIVTLNTGTSHTGH